MSDIWPYRTPGIPDHLFERGRAPMTKEEIRVITLAKARLGPGMVVWDVGGGTGSLSVEAARMTPGGRVYSVERSAGGCRLISQNCVLFGVDNVVVVAGEAPAALAGLPRPDRVMVGGSGGRLKDILDQADRELRPGGRLVVNAVTLETLAGCLDLLGKKWQTEVVQVNISKSEQMGSYRLMKALNPIFIISAWGKGESVAG